MKKKFKKVTVCGVKMTVPCKKWEEPMKERSPRATVFETKKHTSRAKQKQTLRRELAS